LPDGMLGGLWRLIARFTASVPAIVEDAVIEGPSL